MIVTFVDGEVATFYGAAALEIPETGDVSAVLDAAESISISITQPEGHAGTVTLTQGEESIPISSPTALIVISGGVLPDFPTTIKTLSVILPLFGITGEQAGALLTFTSDQLNALAALTPVQIAKVADLP